MGLIKGSAALSRYHVAGALPDGYADLFSSSILRFGFRPLDEEGLAERSTGWVNILDMFDHTLQNQEFFKEPYLALGWRVDMRRVPKSALLEHTRRAQEEIKIRENLEFLSRGRRREIQERVHASLLKRAIPTSKSYEMIWNLHTGELLFGGLSPKLCDEFRDFFLQTFGLHLTLVFPYSMACAALEKARKDPGILDTLTETSFVGPGA